MTDIRALRLLSNLLEAQCHMTNFMSAAMLHSDIDRHCFWLLFLWVEARDERDAIWKKLQGHYFHAVMLREGHQ